MKMLWENYVEFSISTREVHAVNWFYVLTSWSSRQNFRRKI